MSEPKWKPGHVVWRELMTLDVERAKGFYGELFGWRFAEMPSPSGPYTIASAGPSGIAGLMQMGKDMPFPPMWQSYVSVLDVDAACDAARAEGGKVVFGPVTMEGVGRMASLLDFDGAAFSVMRPASDEGRPEGWRPALGEFCWETLSSSDPERAKRFYGAVVGWKDASGSAGMPVLAAPDGAQVVDLQKAERMPPSFLAYVVVESLEAANAKVAALGGKVVVPRIDVPRVGSIAVVADPLGALLGLFVPGT